MERSTKNRERSENMAPSADHLRATVPMETVEDWLEFMDAPDDRTRWSVPDWLKPWLPENMMVGDGLDPRDVPGYRSPLQAARIMFALDPRAPKPPWKGMSYHAFREEWDRIHAPEPEPAPEPEIEWADLYFIGADEGPVKIGVAQHPEKRLRQLQTAYPFPLKLLAVVKGAAPQEPEYHGRFAAHRLRGEWFERCPEILAEIERLGS